MTRDLGDVLDPTPVGGRPFIIPTRLATVAGVEIFTSPWPGPGNSEGPVNPEGWIEDRTVVESETVDLEVVKSSLVTTAPWPGPGDSEG